LSNMGRENSWDWDMKIVSSLARPRVVNLVVSSTNPMKIGG